MRPADNSFHHGKLSYQVFRIGHRLNGEIHVVGCLRTHRNSFSRTSPERNSLTISSSLSSNNERTTMLKSVSYWLGKTLSSHPLQLLCKCFPGCHFPPDGFSCSLDFALEFALFDNHSELMWREFQEFSANCSYRFLVVLLGDKPSFQS